jgi:hypothetical protein
LAGETLTAALPKPFIAMAPGNADENGVGCMSAPLHRSNVGFGSQRYSDANKVCFPQQFIQTAKAGLQGFGFRLRASIPIGDLHVKAKIGWDITVTSNSSCNESTTNSGNSRPKATTCFLMWASRFNSSERGFYLV